MPKTPTADSLAETEFRVSFSNFHNAPFNKVINKDKEGIL